MSKDDAADIDYEPPPAPPGVSPDTAYLGQVYGSGTRAILRDSRKRHIEIKAALKEDDRERGPGISGWLAGTFGKLPVAVQTSLAFGMTYLLLQAGGALLERVTGRPVPQPTMPTIVTQPIPTATAASGEEEG